MNSGQWQPGVSANPGGRRKEKPYRDMLRKVLAEELAFEPKGGEPRTKLEAVVRAHVLEAISGDAAAYREICDRLDGKVPQALVGDEDEAPISVALVELLAVYPKQDEPAR